MVEIVVIVLLFALLVYREIGFTAERKEWAKERGKLLDRIQANGLIEYKQAEMLDKPKVQKEKKAGINFL